MDKLVGVHTYAQTIGSAALVVVQDGRIIDSWGDITRKLEVHSVRKSFLSALIGIAVAAGNINLNATIGSLGIDDVPPSLTAAEKQATILNLLESRSGVYHPALYETEGEKRRRPPRGSHPPGTFWYYNNWDFNVLGTIYEQAVGASIFESFERHIATPIGMQDYRPQDGHYVRGALLQTLLLFGGMGHERGRAVGGPDRVGLQGAPLRGRDRALGRALVLPLRGELPRP